MILIPEELQCEFCGTVRCVVIWQDVDKLRMSCRKCGKTTNWLRRDIYGLRIVY